MLRSQGEASLGAVEMPARNPEHEPARCRLSRSTLGSRHGPASGWPAGCLLPPAASAASPARLLASELNLQPWSVSHAYAGHTLDVRHPKAPWAQTPARSPGKLPTQASQRAEETGISRGYLPLLLLAPPRWPTLGPLCSHLSPRS